MVALSYDVHCMILDAIKEESPYFGEAKLSTIFRYALVCKELAKPALKYLYKDSTLMLHTWSTTEDGRLRRCAWMWRSIILSTCEDSTFLPYCEYIKSIDIGHLEVVLRHSKFTRSIYDEFFAGDLAELMHHDYEEVDGKRLKLSMYKLNTETVVNRLSTYFPHSLKAWVSHLPKLRSLHLVDGASLAENVQESIRVHCRSFEKLKVDNRWSVYNDVEENVGSQAGRFFKGLRPNSLTGFCGPQPGYYDLDDLDFEFGPGLMGGLGCHSKSLISLLVLNLSPEAIVELSTLQAFEALENLVIGGFAPRTGSYELISPVAKWLCKSKNLSSLHVSKFLDNAALLSQVLVDERIRLESLNVDLNDTPAIHRQAFYESLACQYSLDRLIITDYWSDTDAQALETLVPVVSKLNQLRELDLPVYLSLVQLRTLVSCLTELERFTFRARGLNDGIWAWFLGLRKLKALETYSTCGFITARAILDFVLQLGPGNRGLDFRLCGDVFVGHTSAEELDTIGDALKQKGGVLWYDHTRYQTCEIDNDFQERNVFRDRLISLDE